MSSSLSADSLTDTSRVFYERTRTKQVMSILFFTTSLYMLGYCSMAGGQSLWAVRFNLIYVLFSIVASLASSLVLSCSFLYSFFSTFSLICDVFI